MDEYSFNYALTCGRNNSQVAFVRSIVSSPFRVVGQKEFKGLSESTHLSRAFSDQGVRLRLRKEPRTISGYVNCLQRFAGFSDHCAEQSEDTTIHPPTRRQTCIQGYTVDQSTTERMDKTMAMRPRFRNVHGRAAITLTTDLLHRSTQGMPCPPNMAFPAQGLSGLHNRTSLFSLITLLMGH